MKYLWIYVILFFPSWSFTKGHCIGEFELINKMIVVEATIEGRDGYFIVDTGAPDLILNSKYFDGEATEMIASGLGGNTAVEKKVIPVFEWGCVKKTRFSVPIIDLAHLEEAINKTFFGLIGYKILKEKELLIDYQNLKIEQHELKKSDLHYYETPSRVLPFRLFVHAPVLNIELGEKSMKFIVDTASEDNILDRGSISESYATKKTRLLVGVDQNTSVARVIEVPAISLTDISLPNQECLVTNIYNTSAKGILGFPCLKALNKFSINYRKKKIYIWE